EPEIDIAKGTSSYRLYLIMSPDGGYEPKEYSFNAPVTLKFGDFFWASMEERNSNENKPEKLVMFNEQSQPYEWMFEIEPKSFWRRNPWGRNRLIDPERSIIDNQIKDYQRIRCIRVNK
ncbi:MAG: TssN family type VI secretion system protein, partial [Bacteroidota bacterium]